MDILETLKEQRKSIEAKREEVCKPFDVQIAEIDAAIEAVVASRKSVRIRVRSSPQSNHNSTKAMLEKAENKMPIDQAVIEAIKNGVRAPAQILVFLERELGVNTTLNSIRTRLTRLKHNGQVARDERGWIMPNEVSEGLPLEEISGSAELEKAEPGSGNDTSGLPKPN